MTLLLSRSGEGEMIADMHQIDRALTVPSVLIVKHYLLLMCFAVMVTGQE